jgi:hypothetical protein
MSSDRAMPASAARTPADASGSGSGLTLAGLIDVLDRADEMPLRRLPQARRTAAHRPVGTRTGTVRTLPLRSVQPAPMARSSPAARAVVPPEPEPAAAGRLSALVRRSAMWGAGPQGEYLAWRVAPRPVTPAARPAVAPAARRPVAPAARRAVRLRALLRRLALWGSGPGGKYLAWGGPAFPDPASPGDTSSGAACPGQAFPDSDLPGQAFPGQAFPGPASLGRAFPHPRRNIDPPVVLRELPSTPTIQPAAPSPAAALPSRDRASSAGTRREPPVPRGAVAVPGVRPGGPPERSRATGWPPRFPRSSGATGLVRARGDPLSCPVRGSPLPARRSRSPGSAWSSFPRGP